MDTDIFKKMKAKPRMAGRVFNPPKTYPKSAELDWKASGSADFVHLFAESKAQFETSFAAAAAAANDGVLFWVSYPKGSGKQGHDINRDSLWDMLIPQGWHPVSQVSLDETWSAVRLKPNEPGEAYERPNSKKISG